MSNGVVRGDSTVEHSFAESRQSLREEIAEEKLKVNPGKILESLKHLRIPISRIQQVESVAEAKSGGQGTVVPSILLPAEASDDIDNEACSTTDHFVAVKKLRSGEDQDWNRVLAPFAYELQLLDTISHDNIVEVIGFVEDAETGVAWMLFNWEANGNMREVVATAKLEIPERVSLVNDIACGLAHLHSRNPPICQGDLKSLNILINSDFRAIITDFGSARALGSDDANQKTQAENVPVEQPMIEQPNIDNAIKIQAEADSFTLTGQRGTIRWSAPEILEGSRPNLSTDIWAFGWICWEAITGNFPFHEQGEYEDQDLQVILHIVEGKLPVLKNNSELRQIQELCIHMENCWNLNPVQRPTALRCKQILWFMPQVKPQRRKPELPDEAYSSGLLRSLGVLRRGNGQMGDSMYYFVQSLKIAKATGNLADVGLGLREIGRQHLIHGNYTNAEECYVEARDIYTQISDQLGMAGSVKSLGHVHRVRSEYTKAEECYIQARDALSQIGDELGTANAVRSLGDVYRLRGEYTKAEECYIQARDAFSQIGDELGTANAVKGLGYIHQFRAEYTKAEDCYFQARNAYTRIGDHLGMANASIALGLLYQTRKEYEKAKESFVAAHDIASNIDYQWVLDVSANRLREILREQNNPAPELTHSAESNSSTVPNARRPPIIRAISNFFSPFRKDSTRVFRMRR